MKVKCGEITLKQAKGRDDDGEQMKTSRRTENSFGQSVHHKTFHCC